MNTSIGRRALLALVPVSLGMSAQSDDAKSDRDLRATLVGTWKPIKMMFNGQDSGLPTTSVTFKHVTPVGFTWLSYEKETGKIFRAGGGTYTVKNGRYTEKIEYGVGGDFEVVRKMTVAFKCEVTGDRWHSTGTLGNGTTIDEVWERVKPAKE